MRRLISLLLAIAAGFAFWLAFPDVGWWPFNLVGCALLWAAFEVAAAPLPATAGSTVPVIAGSTSPVIAGSTSPVIAGSSSPVIAGSSSPVIAGSTSPVIAGSTRNLTTMLPSRLGSHQHGLRPGWCALLGLVAGCVFFGPHVWWAQIATAYIPWVALVLLQAAFFAALGALWAFTRRIPLVANSIWWQALAFAVLFTGVEQWRSSIPFGGFPWGRLAWSVAGAPTGRAAWLGASVLVTFILAYAAMLLVTAICQFRRLHRDALPNSWMRQAGDGQPGHLDRLRTPLEPTRVNWLGYRITKAPPWLAGLGAITAAAALLFGPLLLPLPHDPRNLAQVADPPVTTYVDRGDRVAWVDAGMRTAEHGTLRVGIAQGNVPGRAEAEFNAGPVFENHLNETYQLAQDTETRIARIESGENNWVWGATNVLSAANEGYDVIVWPENAAAWDPTQWPAVAAAMDDAAEAVGAPILIGSMEYPDAGGRYNVMLLWDAEQGVISRYAKQRPAPFGEFIPFRTVARMITDQVDRLPVDMIAAVNPPIIDVPMAGGEQIEGTPFRLFPTVSGFRTLPEVPMGVGICFEVAYDDIFIDAARRDAEVIIVPTNNASFGVTPQSTQQLQMTQMQAITTGKAAVQISTVGVSGVFTPDGKLVARTGLFAPDRISALLPLRTTRTPAVELGMGPARVFQGLAIALPIIGWLCWHDAKKTSELVVRQTN